MPFDPKLIQPDAAPLLPDGEIDLPADLTALGERLRDDALHLARCYPAGGAVAGASAAAPRSRPWKKMAVLATSGLATALAVVVAVQVVGPLGNRRQTIPAADRGAEHQAVAATDTTATTAAEAISGTSPAAISLTELSGPELEALIDLWQREPPSAEGSSISF
jgi:hypothetical protein